jgi:HSP20 family molecular chaperone IbpA
MSTISNSPQGTSPSRNELSEQYRTQKSEKEALAEQHEAEMGQLKKSYALEKASLEDRFEQSTQDERLSHYDQLRNTKSKLNQEERRLDDMRKEIIGTKTNDLNKEQVKAEYEGAAKVNDVKAKYATAEEYERNRANAAYDEVRSFHKETAEHIVDDSNKKVQALEDQKQAELITKKETHAQALDQMKEHYDGLRTSTEEQYAAGFQAFENRATADLEARKIASTQKLQNYVDRQNDPFYKMNRFDSTLQDAGDAYVLRVRVPTYERDLFKVQVSGQEIQLNGVRSFSEKSEVEPGRWISTSSQQNITERVPLDAPVDGRAMSVQSKGEWVEYTLPKFGPHRRIGSQYKTNADLTADAVDAATKKELEFKDTLPKPSLPHLSKS